MSWKTGVIKIANTFFRVKPSLVVLMYSCFPLVKYSSATNGMSVKSRRGKDHKFLIELFSVVSMLTHGPINAPPRMLKIRMTSPEIIQRVYLHD